jgi:hypothetical protein
MIYFTKSEKYGALARWKVTRNGLDLGTVVLHHDAAVRFFSNSYGITSEDLPDIARFMNEVHGQHRSNQFSEQIERDMLPVARQEVTNEHSDPHSRADRFAGIDRGRPLADPSPVVAGHRHD